MTAGTVSEGHIYDAVVVGGGAAGVGAAVALKHAGVGNFVVLERHMVGASFALWPAETRFITPSFATNSIGMLDLNSIAIGVSPAFSLEVEHPTGEHYALHLNAVAQYFELPVQAPADVRQMVRSDEVFTLDTTAGTFQTRHVIWATGEFQYPRLDGFPGSELCEHTANIARYEDMEGDDFIVVGGYESGVDAAYHLAHRNKRVRLFDRGRPWRAESSDPSVALSTYSLERMRSSQFGSYVRLFPNTPIASVACVDSLYEVTTQSGQCYRTPTKPLLAGGFTGGLGLVEHMFMRRDDGSVVLNKDDESTLVPGLFVCGPAVRHDKQVFCFIYKYRQRFAVVAKAIATSLGLRAEFLETYRNWGMYLDDLSICGEECVC
ncbi:MAG: NAD(P)/FAD-dependent oxidoreductase [Pseudomonadota bacterium]